MLRQRAILFRNANIAADTAVMFVAFVASYFIRRDVLHDLWLLPPMQWLVGYFGGDLPAGLQLLNPAVFEEFVPFIAVSVPVWMGCLIWQGMYKTHRVHSLVRIVWIALRGIGLGLGIMFAVMGLLRVQPSIPLIALCAGLSFLFVVAENVAAREILRYLRARGYNYRTVLVVGTGSRAGKVIEVVRNHVQWGLRIVGCVDVDPELVGKTVHGVPVIADMSNFRDILFHNAVDEVIFALPFRYSHVLAEYLRICEEEGVSTRVMADFYQLEIAKATMEEIDGIPMLSYMTTPSHTFSLFVKQAIDTFGSMAALLLLSPLLAAIAAAIKLDSPGPVFFLQERVGLNKRRFLIYKFRTMVANADAMKEELAALNEKSGPIFKIKRDPRVTRVGRWLRKFSLDELPQILNVFKGEMSFIGPRPPVPQEVVKYEHWQRRRLSMKPGISGLWQVSGRSDVDFDQWMKLDLEYIDNWSLALDLKIFLKTFPVVLFGKGAY